MNHPTKRPLNILLLCNYDANNAAMVTDHINALCSYSKHRVFVYNDLISNEGDLPDEIDLECFDAILVHYSIFIGHEVYCSNKTLFRLRCFGGVKAVFIQDEYRFVEQTISALQNAAIDILFTCVPSKAVNYVYPDSKLPDVQKINVLTGYVPYFLTIEKPLALDERKIDVGYRGRVYPSWHGRLGQEKHQIARRFVKDAKGLGLSLDISCQEDDRLYGCNYVDFIKNCRAILGVESGASIFDFDGRISGFAETYEALLGENTTYEEIRDKIFSDQEDTIEFAQISPRCFETIALRTMLILYEGSYSGVLTPWKHYVPLKKDHSNFKEVVQILNDPKHITEITSNAFADIACTGEYSYRNFVGTVVDRALEERWESKAYSRKNPQDEQLSGFRDVYDYSRVRNPHGIIFSPRPNPQSLLGTAKWVLGRGTKKLLRNLPVLGKVKLLKSFV